MKLTLRRFFSTDKDTLGFLWSDDHKVECFTLEDAYHDQKIYGQTRIPAGTYKLGLFQSPHFGKQMIYLLNVPNYDGIMIHNGNKNEDTLGCILVGDTSNLFVGNEDTIANSNQALNRIQPQITTAILNGDTFITIIDEDR